MGGKERNHHRHTQKENSNAGATTAGRRIASHCTWADGEGGRRRRRGLLFFSPSCNSPVLYTLLAPDDCVINVPSPSLQMEPARFFIFSYSNGVSRVRRADDADAFAAACLCSRCMLVGHLNPPHGPLSSSLTMIDVSSFLSPRPSFFLSFLSSTVPSLPLYVLFAMCVLLYR